MVPLEGDGWSLPKDSRSVVELENCGKKFIFVLSRAWRNLPISAGSVSRFVLGKNSARSPLLSDALHSICFSCRCRSQLEFDGNWENLYSSSPGNGFHGVSFGQSFALGATRTPVAIYMVISRELSSSFHVYSDRTNKSMRDFCPWCECRNLYQVSMYSLWTRLDRLRSGVVVHRF